MPYCDYYLPDVAENPNLVGATTCSDEVFNAIRGKLAKHSPIVGKLLRAKRAWNDKFRRHSDRYKKYAYPRCISTN